MLRRIQATNGVVYYRADLLAEIAGVPHAFSTRLGGISPPPFDSLNLGNPTGCDLLDADTRISQNYAILEQTIGCQNRTRCWVHQVHGDLVENVMRDKPFVNGAKADAMICDDSSRIVAVRAADCVPILIASDDGRHVAAVHAGWRGVIAGVLVKTVLALRRRTDRPLLVAIGPSISLDAFEVGPDVLEEFDRAFSPADDLVRRRADGKGHADLRGALRVQAHRDCSIPTGHIESSDRCTCRDSDEFFSHRRDRGITGRMAALISPRSGA